jgi:hypothetical protein
MTLSRPGDLRLFLQERRGLGMVSNDSLVRYMEALTEYLDAEAQRRKVEQGGALRIV